MAELMIDENNPPQDERPTPSKGKDEAVVFKPPENFKPPEVGEQQGKQWDIVCTFETWPDGRIWLAKLGDSDMPKPMVKPKEHVGDEGIDQMAESLSSGT
jgi:hypothetical protein